MELQGTNNLDMEFELIVVRSSNKAVLFVSDKDPLNKFWLPKSKITMESAGKEIVQPHIGEILTVQLPRWLAEVKEILA